MEINFTTEKSKKMAENLWFSVYTEQNKRCALQSIDYLKKMYEEVPKYISDFQFSDMLNIQRGKNILDEIKELISSRDTFNEKSLKSLKDRIIIVNDEIQEIMDEVN